VKSRAILRSLCATLGLVVVISLPGCGGGDGGGGANSAPASADGGGAAPDASNSQPTLSTAPNSPAVSPIPEIGLAFSGAQLGSSTPVVPARKQPMAVGDMVYDPARDQLLVSTILGNTFGIIALRPADLAVLWFIPTSSAATTLSISDDSNELYAGLFFESTIEQFDLNSHMSVRRFQVGAAGSGFGPLNIAVRPGAPNTVAVSVGSDFLVPTFSELDLFVAGVRQSKSYNDPFGTRASKIAFVDANTLLGFDDETTAYSVSRLAVADDGVTQDGFTLGNCCFSSSISVAAGRAFVTNGMFVDPRTLKSVKTFGGNSATELYHPGTDSVLVVNPDVHASTVNSVQLLVQEYDYTRGYLKRSFRVDETLPGTSPASGVTGQVYLTIAVGASSFAMLVADEFSGSTAVLVYDLASVPPLASHTFEVQSATQNGATAMAISLPVLAYAYDPDGDRIAATVPPSLGPQGNSLAIIRAADGVVTKLVPLSSEPRNVSVSATGGIAYVSLPFENAVQAIDLNTGGLLWKTRIQFPISMPHNEETTDGFTADSIAVKPDDPQTIIVGGCESWDDCGRILGVFQNGNQVAMYRSFSVHGLFFYGIAELVALDWDTPRGYVTRFSVTGNTLTLVASTPGLLDIPASYDKVDFGFAYGLKDIADIHAGRSVGRFAPTSVPYFPFYDQTLLMSATTAVGHNQQLNSTSGPPAEFYDVMTESVQADGTLVFSAQSRIKITDQRFNEGFKGMMVPMTAKRFVQGFTKSDHGIGVLYVITTP